MWWLKIFSRHKHTSQSLQILTQFYKHNCFYNNKRVIWVIISFEGKEREVMVVVFRQPALYGQTGLYGQQPIYSMPANLLDHRRDPRLMQAGFRGQTRHSPVEKKLRVSIRKIDEQLRELRGQQGPRALAKREELLYQKQIVLAQIDALMQERDTQGWNQSQVPVRRFIAR